MSNIISELNLLSPEIFIAMMAMFILLVGLFVDDKNKHVSYSLSQFTLLSPRIIDPPSTADWAIFLTLQIADIYTTYRGLKYDCVRELNPLIGERPSVSDMMFTKTVILVPAIQYDLENGNLTKKSIRQINGFMAMVVGNNYNVWHRSEKYCKKR